MIVQMITAVVLSIVLLLMTWAVFRTLRKPMPGALVPVIIGATVIIYGIYSEYTWESRTLKNMPESVEVVQRVASKSVFSPWAYLFPRIDKLSVIDTQSMRRHEEHKEFVMLELLILQRFSPVLQIRQFVDCQNARRADLDKDPSFNEQGLPAALEWRSLSQDHRLLQVACKTSGYS